MRLIPLFSLLLLFSCAGIKPIKRPKRKQVDADVEKTFQELEREKILDYYFQLRIQDQENQREERQSQKKSRVKLYRPSFEPAKPRPSRKVIAPKPRRPKILVNPEENQIRMNQMLSFYCMKSRGGDSCQQRAQNIKQSCRDEFDLDDQRLIRCIETKLR